LTFGRHLSAQKTRDDWIGDLARAAEKDSRFPWSARPGEIYDHVSRHMGGDGTVLQALIAAIEEWHGGPYNLREDGAR
jgi:hypothetical protein